MGLKLGELLIRSKLITSLQLEEALSAQRTYGGKLGTNLVELGHISDVSLAQFLSRQLNIPSASPKDFEVIPKQILDLVPASMAEEHKMIPLKSDVKLTVAISDPGDLAALDELSFKTGKRVQAMIAPEIWILAALERHYKIPRQTRYLTIQPEEPSYAGWDASSRGQEMLNIGGTITMDTGFSLEMYVDRLLKTVSKEDVFGALMDFVSSYFPRSAIYIARKEHLIGWMLRGFPVHLSQFQKVQEPRTSDTTFKAVLQDMKPYFGAIPGRPGDISLTRILSLSPRTQVGLFPITFRSAGVAVLLGCTEGPGGLDEKNANMVQLACVKASLGLELGAIRKSLAEMPGK